MNDKKFSNRVWHVVAKQTAVVGLVFTIGLMIGLSAPALAQQAKTAAEKDPSLRFLSAIYAITTLAVDIEISAVEIVELKNRMNRLEVLLGNLQKQRKSNED